MANSTLSEANQTIIVIKIVKKLLQNLTPPIVLSLYGNLNIRLQSVFARKKMRPHTKLNLGCGSNMIEGWANIDLTGNKKVIRWDLTKPLPIRSNTIRFIYSEHFIEHISFEQAKSLIGECYRVLQHGGVLRISTLSLKKLIDEYLSGRLHEWSNVGWKPSTPCRMMNEGMRLWGHQFVYDIDELKSLFEENGFCNVTQVS